MQQKLGHKLSTEKIDINDVGFITNVTHYETEVTANYHSFCLQYFKLNFMSWDCKQKPQ